MSQLFLPQAATGKRAVVWTLLCFAASQLALTLYLDYRRPEVRDPLYGYRLRSLKERLAKSPSAPLVLALGSSRVKNSLWPSAMKVRAGEGTETPVIYNFGLNGMGTIRELMYLRRLLADGIRPDWLFLELWPPLWVEDGYFRESRMVHWEDDLRWRDVSLVRRYFPKDSAILLQGLRRTLLPISHYRGNLLQAAFASLLSREQVEKATKQVKDWLPDDEDGWFPNPWQVISPELRRTALQHGIEEVKPLLDHLRIDPRSDAALREVLELCRKYNIKVAVMLLPEPSVTRGWYTPQGRALVHDYLGRIRQEYQLPIVDSRDWVADEDFVDTCHVGVSGVVPFSERVGREVVQPLLDGKPLDKRVLFTP